MRKLFPLLIFFVLLSTSYAQNYGAKSIFKKYNDAVVVIYACDSYGKPFAQGSGVVLNSQGLVVTNYHVCDGASIIKIKHEDLIIEDVTVLGGDKDDDIMFLKVPQNNFNYIPAGNSDKLEIGQKVYALGSPLGFENSITEGIVNGIRKISRYSGDNYIQISASISHGSSGGALITAGGKLVGITCGGIEDGQNINFALPINKILASGIYAANKFEEDETVEKKEKKTKKKKKDDSITSTDTEKKTKKPRKKKKKDSEEIYSGSSSTGITQNPGSSKSEKPSGTSFKENYNKGDAAYTRKDFNSALEYFNQCVSIEPDNALGYFCRGLCYAQLKKYESALSDLNYVIRLSPDVSLAYTTRAHIYEKMEKYYDAIKDYTSALELDRTNKYALYGLGSCYYELDEYEKSVLCMTAYILIDNTDPWAYYIRGRCTVEGNLDYENLDECKDFNRAYSLGLDDAKEYIDQYCK
ncbi:MAG: tetratricopeptide repeat protein [Bacteroidetes bacterium]|nr:tetratricopeptide repeat protein [Bacteroidota bacterium]